MCQAVRLSAHPEPGNRGDAGRARIERSHQSQVGVLDPWPCFQSLCVRFPCVAGAALRALADRRRLTARVGLGRSRAPCARRGGRLSFEVMFPAVPDDRRTHASPSAANRVVRRAARGRFATMRVDGSGQDGTRADAAAAGALVFAVAAGWWRIPSPSATASGSPNRLLCPDPVRHMSVISGSVELTIVYCGGLRHRLERVAVAGLVGCSRSSAPINERNSGWRRRAGRRARTRRAHSCPARASGLQTARSGWQC